MALTNIIKKAAFASAMSLALLGGIDSINAEEQQPPKTQKRTNFKEEAEERIEKILFQRSVDAIRISGHHGGSIIMPREYFKSQALDLAYLYDKGENKLIPKKDLETQMSRCISFELYGSKLSSDILLSVKKENPEVTVSIQEEFVDVSAKFPVTASYRGNILYKLKENYQTRVNLGLGKMLQMADAIVNLMVKNKYPIEERFLRDDAYAVRVYSADMKNKLIVYTITDTSKDRMINGATCSLAFAARFGDEKQKHPLFMRRFEMKPVKSEDVRKKMIAYYNLAASESTPNLKIFEYLMDQEKYDFTKE